jgi:mono/diheme cytochrome c family protein
MKLFIKIPIILISLIVLVAIAGIIYLKTAFPKVSDAQIMKVKSNPEIIARGKYLAENVALCIDCHSTRNWDLFSGPIIQGTEGKGGELFDKNIGLPGSIYSSNITPFNLGSWTDGEIYRVITCGVNKNNESLFPLMPYKAYASMDPEDVKAIIAYLRTLSPIKSSFPKHDLTFPMNLIVNTIPSDATPMKRPPSTDTLAYGKYLVKIAACADCHTPAVKGKQIEGMEFAGGFQFGLPKGGKVRSTNITPDTETGIGKWTLQNFIDKFKNFATEESKHLKVNPGAFNTIMPMTQYAGLTTEDLTAMYKFLRTVKPVKNKVEIFTKQ